MNCPGYKKLKKIFNFWMGPPFSQSQMWLNSQGYLWVNSRQKSHSPLVAFDLPLSQSWCLHTTLMIPTMFTVERYPKHTKPCIHSKIPAQITEWNVTHWVPEKSPHLQNTVIIKNKNKNNADRAAIVLANSPQHKTGDANWFHPPPEVTLISGDLHHSLED